MRLNHFKSKTSINYPAVQSTSSVSACYAKKDFHFIFYQNTHNILNPGDLDDYVKDMPIDMAHRFKSPTEAHGCTFDLWHKRFGHADKRRIKFLDHFHLQFVMVISMLYHIQMFIQDTPWFIYLRRNQMHH
mmetsp:Transcript_23743/g.27892  ORF Transcript_23743/g.27892 Transcript_23743/m.27892 type:complete len:131 (-) Transcript_23743:2757-3149(-)